MDYLTSAQLTWLMTSLISRTEAGLSKWTPAGHDYEFKTHGKQFFYFIASGDKDDLAPYIFEIWSGDPLGETPSGAAKLQYVSSSQFAEHNESLRILYEAAKRTSLRLDEVTAEILSDFD